MSFAGMSPIMVYWMTHDSWPSIYIYTLVTSTIPSLLDVSVKRQVHKLLATFQVESMPFRDSGQDLRSGASGGWGAFIWEAACFELEAFCLECECWQLICFHPQSHRLSLDLFCWSHNDLWCACGRKVPSLWSWEGHSLRLIISFMLLRSLEWCSSIVVSGNRVSVSLVSERPRAWSILIWPLRMNREQKVWPKFS